MGRGAASFSEALGGVFHNTGAFVGEVQLEDWNVVVRVYRAAYPLQMRSIHQWLGRNAIGVLVSAFLHHGLCSGCTTINDFENPETVLIRADLDDGCGDYRGQQKVDRE